MRCPNCDSENPDTTRFCIECGGAFEHRCLKCQFGNLPRAKFCGRCGSSLTESIAPQTSGGPIASGGVSVDARERRSGERRHLTVLFCDLVGSTAIAAQLDPEEWRETVAGHHGAAAEAITRFDGLVAKYLGDGVVAYFGPILGICKREFRAGGLSPLPHGSGAAALAQHNIVLSYGLS
jgi:hypothetical protein